jgi:hypothetical protein
MKRRAVASYLTGIVVDRCDETVTRLASGLGLKDQVCENDPGRAWDDELGFVEDKIIREAEGG